MKGNRQHFLRTYFAVFGLSFSLFFSLFSQQVDRSKNETMSVNSGEFQYDGNEVILVGQVDVQHSLGHILARRLSFVPAGNSFKKNQNGFFKISGDVQIALKAGGILYCQQAELDYGKMKGVFLGNEEVKDVRFSMDAPSDPLRSFDLKCDRLTLSLMHEAAATSSDSSKIVVREIDAEQNVRVAYQEYLLLGDCANFLSESSSGGLLTITAVDKLKGCLLKNVKGDIIEAESITMRMDEKKILLEKPCGTLALQEKNGAQKELKFSSKKLLIEDGGKKLRLIGDVLLTQDGLLRLETDHELILSQEMHQGKNIFRTLQCPKETNLTYLDSSQNLDRKIYSPGPLKIDQLTLEMTMQGIASEEKKGEGHEGQVLFEDNFGDVHADKVKLQYAFEKGRFAIRHMILEGSVSLVNRFDGHPEESGSILHIALSDEVIYKPDSNEMFFSSIQGKRVLFIDSVNHVQMSAPSLTIRHESLSHKNTIQGFGDVRFTFLENELKELAGRFPLAESLKKKN